MHIPSRRVNGPVELLLLSEVGRRRLMMGLEGAGEPSKPRARQNRRSSFPGLTRPRRPHRDLFHAGGTRCCVMLVRKPQATVTAPVDQRKSLCRATNMALRQRLEAEPTLANPAYKPPSLGSSNEHCALSQVPRRSHNQTVRQPEPAGERRRRPAAGD